MTMRRGLLGQSWALAGAIAGAARAARPVAVKARRRIVSSIHSCHEHPTRDVGRPDGQHMTRRRFRLSMKITVVLFSHDRFSVSSHPQALAGPFRQPHQALCRKYRECRKVLFMLAVQARMNRFSDPRVASLFKAYPSA